MKMKFKFILLILIPICSQAAGQGNTADDLIKEGWALINVASYTEAVTCFDKAISLNPSNPEAWRGKGYALNGEGYEKDDAKEYTEARGYYEEAIPCLEKAIQLNSSYVDAYMDMADSENRLDNLSKALEIIDKAISIDGNNAEAINVKGTIYYRMGKYEEAIESFRKATKMNPKLPNGWNNLCDILKEQKKGDPNAAKEADNACQRAADLYNAEDRH